MDSQYTLLPSTCSSTSLEDLPGAYSQNVVTCDTEIDIDINNSSGIIVGDIFISQTVVNEEVVKARLLCLQFQSAVNMRRFRCSLAVFLCWSLIVTSSAVFYIVIFVIPHSRLRIDIDLVAPWYIRRMEWLSLSDHDLVFLHLPIRQVLIDQNERGYCNLKPTCSEMMISLQESQLHLGYPDVGANYLVGGNGWVFEGTGANVRSFFKLGWDGDDKSIVIMFLGNYAIDKPDQAQFDHVNKLLDVLVQSSILHKDYKLYGTCQVDTYTDNPGPKLMRRLHKFTHWDSANESTCLPGVP